MDGPDVALLEWPEQESLRQDLADQGKPRLLTIGPDVGPPLLLDDAEDWIRRPFSKEDLNARVRTLITRRDDPASRPPRIDEYGILRAGGLQCFLSPVEARLLGVLFGNGTSVTTRDELATAGWQAKSVTRNGLDIAMMRLRRTIEPYGVMIRTVRGRGYAIETA